MGGVQLRKDEHVLGSPDRAVVQLVVYGDYECPYTARGMRMIRAVRARAGQALLVAFRNFPLAHKHRHALAAAYAAEAAAEQGQFWEMHERLMANQGALTDEDLMEYAADLDLDVEQFAADLRAKRTRDRVRKDHASGEALEVTSTPTLFIDGQKYDGPVDGIPSVLEQALSGIESPAQAPGAG